MAELTTKENTLKIPMPSVLVNTVHRVIGKACSQFERDGIILEKGAIITPRRIDAHRALYERYCRLWSVYPDLYISLATPRESKFRLKFFQILFLRACLRHGRMLMIAPRAAGKSFICVLALYLVCMFRPGSHVRKDSAIIL